jgi:hypothetical protein
MAVPEFLLADFFFNSHAANIGIKLYVYTFNFSSIGKILKINEMELFLI